MHDTIKGVLYCAVLAALIAGFVAWFGHNGYTPLSATWWTFRVVSILVLIVGIGLLVWGRHRTDKAPDYLRDFIKKPYESNGLCFGVLMESENGIAELHVYFQNRFSRPCNAHVNISLRHGFAFSKKRLETFRIPIHCEGGAFGLARMPMSVRNKWQGKKKLFEIDADTNYPRGRGELLRVKPGIRATSEAALGDLLTVISALVGPLGLFFASANYTRRFKLRYPRNVADVIPTHIQPSTETLWEPGDEDANDDPAAMRLLPEEHMAA